LAHRGASAVAPENTAAAFTAARDLAADGVELDVRRTRDGALAIHHDAELDGIGAIVEHDLTDLRRAHPDLLTLDLALDICDGLLVNIEIKNHPDDPDFDPDEYLANEIVALLERRARRDRVVISSFHLDTIDRVKALAPTLTTSWLTGAEDPLLALETVRERGHEGVNPFFGMLAGDTAKTVFTHAHAHGLTVTPWTVDDPVIIRMLAEAGVDAIITNVPDVAREAMI
jgi:glycerophosphoryl diester phosphodiesterase